MKAIILQPFHRYVSEGEGEREEHFPAGVTVTAGQNGVSAEDVADWIAKGLAKAAE